MRKILCFTLALLLAAGFAACGKNTQPTNPAPTLPAPTFATQPEPTVPQLTLAPSQPFETSPETVPETEPQPVLPAIPAIVGNVFSGHLTQDQTDTYTFTPENSGVHHFNMDINNVSCNYRLQIFTPKNACVADSKYKSSQMNPCTPILEAGVEYTVYVSYEYNECDYTVTIGCPDPVREITGTTVSGTLGYLCEEDVYTYTAPVTGLYRFSLAPSDVTANFAIRIIDTKQQKLRETTYGTVEYAAEDPGVTAELTAGETYTLELGQTYRFCDYTVTVHVPNEPQVVGTGFSGSFTFWEQENVYLFTPDATGTYEFHMYTSNAPANFRIYVTDHRNATVMDTTYGTCAYATNDPYCTLNLTAGVQYTISLEQTYDLTDYQITITLP